MPNKAKAIKNQNKKIKKTKVKLRKNTRRLRILKRRVNRISRRNRGIKYATTKRVRRFNRIMRSSANSLTVSGQDLVYKIPDKEFIAQDLSDVFALIPANPAYWKGTRISTLANGYQQYRPIKIIIKYVPSVAANISGNVFIGTIWNSSVIDSQLEQTLPTTPGGLITQCYSPATRRIPLGRSLSQNLYNLSGDLSKDSNPFYIVGIAKDIVKDNVKINPGLIYIQYIYHFKNPINSMVAYRNTGMIRYKDVIFCENTSLVTLKSYTFDVNVNGKIVSKTVNSLTQLEVEREESGVNVCTYNGSYVPIQDDDVVWAFQNEPVNEGVPQSGEIVPFIRKEIQITHCFVLTGQFATGLYPYAYYILPRVINGERYFDLTITYEDPDFNLTNYEPYNNDPNLRYILTISPTQLQDLKDIKPVVVHSYFQATAGEYVPGWSKQIYNKNKFFFLRYAFEDIGHSITINVPPISSPLTSAWPYPSNPYVPSQLTLNQITNPNIKPQTTTEVNVKSKQIIKKDDKIANSKDNINNMKRKSRSKSKTKKIIKEEIYEDDYPEEEECLTKSELDELENLDKLEQKGP